jgi:hypothetical protein
MKKLLLLIFCIVNISFSQSGREFMMNTLNLETEIKSNINSEKTIQTEFFNSNSELSNVNPAAKKKVGLALIYSLLLPGMGELYAGSYSTGKYFTIAEGALWSTFIGMNVYGSWQQDRYKAFAVSRAGINPDGKDEDYYATISEYLDIEQYNNEKALERRFTEMYNTERYYWNWENPDDRRTYRSMWVSSEQTFNDVRFVAGLLIVNRLVSAINAVRLVAAYNKRVEEEASWNIYMGLNNQVNLPASVTINFQTSF